MLVPTSQHEILRTQNENSPVCSKAYINSAFVYVLLITTKIAPTVAAAKNRETYCSQLPAMTPIRSPCWIPFASSPRANRSLSTCSCLYVHLAFVQGTTRHSRSACSRHWSSNNSPSVISHSSGVFGPWKMDSLVWA